MKYDVTTEEFYQRFLNGEFKNNPLIQVCKSGYINLYFRPFLIFGMPDQIWHDNLYAYTFGYSKRLKRPYHTKRSYYLRYWKAICKIFEYPFDEATFKAATFREWVTANGLNGTAFEIPRKSIIMELVKSGKKTWNNLRKQGRMLDKMLIDGAKEFQMRKKAKEAATEKTS